MILSVNYWWIMIKKIDGFDYKIDDLGNVTKDSYLIRDINQFVENVKIEGKFDARGVLVVRLHKDGRKFKRDVKRLVAEAYLQNDKKFSSVMCLDGDETNCSAENLMFVKKSNSKKNGKLDIAKVRKIRALVKGGQTQYSVAKEMNLSASMICRIMSNDRWTV